MRFAESSGKTFCGSSRPCAARPDSNSRASQTRLRSWRFTMNVGTHLSVAAGLGRDFLDRTNEHLIGGEWVPSQSGETFVVIDPAEGSEIAQAALGDRGDVDAAVQAAREALGGPWSSAPHAER